MTIGGDCEGDGIDSLQFVVQQDRTMDVLNFDAKENENEREC